MCDNGAADEAECGDGGEADGVEHCDKDAAAWAAKFGGENADRDVVAWGKAKPKDKQETGTCGDAE
jgi:hypothetical protein